jgi:hypothetical protein
MAKASETIRKYEKDNVALRLTREEYWTPSGQMHEGADFTLYSAGMKLFCDIKLPDYQASLNLLSIESQHSVDEYLWGKHTKRELRESSKNIVEGRLSRFPSLEQTLQGIFDGAIQKGLLGQLKEMYGSAEKIPQSEYFESLIVLPEQLISRSKGMEISLNKMRGYIDGLNTNFLSVDPRTGRSIPSEDPIGYCRGQIEMFERALDEAGRNLDSLRRLVHESSGLVPKKTGMTEKETGRLCSEARKLIRDNFAYTINNSSLPKQEQDVWLTRLGIKR